MAGRSSSFMQMMPEKLGVRVLASDAPLPSLPSMVDAELNRQDAEVASLREQVLSMQRNVVRR